MKGRAEDPDLSAIKSGKVQDVRHKQHQQKRRPLKFEEIRPQDKKGGAVKSSLSDYLGCILSLLGGLLVITGIALVIGNMSGKFQTFPFAGFITMSIGLAVLAVGLRKS